MKKKKKKKKKRISIIISEVTIYWSFFEKIIKKKLGKWESLNFS